MLGMLAIALIAVFVFLASVHVDWAVGDFRLVGFFKTVRAVSPSRGSAVESGLEFPLHR